MMLYYTTQVTSPRMPHTNHKAENSMCIRAHHTQKTEGQEGLIKPKKFSNPLLESPSHRELHRELRVTHRWGLLPGPKCELQRVMEQRRLEQDQIQQPLTDLEQELIRRQQRLLEHEMEEQRRRQELENVPEFVRVRDNLRPIRVSGH